MVAEKGFAVTVSLCAVTPSKIFSDIHNSH